MCDTIVTVDNNKVIIDTIDAFNNYDNLSLRNVIDVILNVEVPNTETGHDNLMLEVVIHFESKWVGYNINVCKHVNKYDNEDVNEDLNEDGFVSEYVDNNDNEVINDDIADGISVVRKFPSKRKKIVPSIAEHDVEELVTHILDVVYDNKKVTKHVVKRVIIVKMSIEGKKLLKNTPCVPFENVSFHHKESISKWNFVYIRRTNLERKPYVKVQKCSEIMKLFSDAQLFNIMLNFGSYYPKSVKEFVIKLPIKVPSLIFSVRMILF